MVTITEQENNKQKNLTEAFDFLDVMDANGKPFRLSRTALAESLKPLFEHRWQFKKVDSKPEIGVYGYIYLVPVSGQSGVYDQYIWANEVMEPLGRTTLDFSDAVGKKTAEGGELFNDAISANLSAHAEGSGTEANGKSSHAEGNGTQAKGYASHAEGSSTVVNNYTEHAEGSYNVSNKSEGGEGTRHSVGIGGSQYSRKNAHEILANGSHYVYGVGGYDGTNAVTPNAKGVKAKTLQEIICENSGDYHMAFFIDINKASSRGSEYVDTGGNMEMRELFESESRSILMNDLGEACLLNPKDCRYTVEGDAVLNGEKLNSHFDHCDMMKIIPAHYLKIQKAGSFNRLWISLSPIPGGRLVPEFAVGKFKAHIDPQGKMRSIPGVIPSSGRNIRSFWDCAQTRSKSHGLANSNFRNYLCFSMMSKYSFRNCQTCKTPDGTLIWGVGLDGSESIKGKDDKFSAQKDIVTGSTLVLGDKNGNVAVKDKFNDTCHSVNVFGFENAWGQYWEMVQGLCSVGTDVFNWEDNFVPPASPNPTADTFANMDCVKIRRPDTTSGTFMNEIADGTHQGVVMIPAGPLSGVSYGDGYWSDPAGQLWLFGGVSSNGSSCGLVFSTSSYVWTDSGSVISARLAYYGDIKIVSSRDIMK